MSKRFLKYETTEHSTDIEDGVLKKKKTVMKPDA